MLRHYRHSASGTRSAAAATTQPAAASGDAAAVSAEDYARAEAFTAEGVGGLVSSGGLMSFTGRGGIGIGASWLPDETLWYRDGDGAVVLVDPAAKTTAVCDDATCADLGIPAAASGGAAATAGASGGPPLPSAKQLGHHNPRFTTLRTSRRITPCASSRRRCGACLRLTRWCPA